jgi:hypothetical protein
MPKRTKITLETESVLILRGRGPMRARCPECGLQVEMILHDETGVVSNLNPPEVKAWIEPEEPHPSQGAGRTPLVCLNSMLKRVRKAAIASRAEKV